MATGSNQEKQYQYQQIIERVFFGRFQPGDAEVYFERADIVHAAEELGLQRPANLGDVIYSMRYRQALPESIQSRAPTGKEWVIRGRGKARYSFEATSQAVIEPSEHHLAIKVPDATPGIISMYALGDEQALLAQLRYNRLLDIFSGVTCYSLQSHLRTAVADVGQVEVDEVYLGIDRRGAHYVFPVQAKGGSDRLSIVQIDQDVAMCAEKFPELVCRPVAAQFVGSQQSDRIALFLFEDDGNGRAALEAERHYRLSESGTISWTELEFYRNILSE